MFTIKQKKLLLSSALERVWSVQNCWSFDWLLILIAILSTGIGNLLLPEITWGLTQSQGLETSWGKERKAHLKGSVAQRSNDAEAYYQQGNTYLKQQDYDRAIAEYTRAIALDPTHIYAYDKLAESYRKLSDQYFYSKQPDKSRATYDKVIEVNGKEFRQGSVTCGQNEGDQREVAILTKEFAAIFCNSNVYHNWDDVTGEMVFAGEYYYVSQSRQNGEIKKISNATRSINEAKRIITFQVTEGQNTYRIETNEGLNTNFIFRNERRYLYEEPCWRTFSILQNGKQIYHQMLDGCPN
ncbi:c-type cytochrome biogenesis protein [Pseudanabaena sp. BC1403]|uniref:tetratricopeptide repeat protein n=1 Tax=Pseudanabaena sp. BC1403 TaxID=2043171 RepID=UPI000CD84869|nr:tetratricopeptide repeat protein [Pseudanabaena sp. BC1403]